MRVFYTDPEENDNNDDDGNDFDINFDYDNDIIKSDVPDIGDEGFYESN